MLRKKTLLFFLGATLVSCASKNDQPTKSKFINNKDNTSLKSSTLSSPKKIVTVNFGFDSYDISQSEMANIKSTMKNLNASPERLIYVVRGHTDEIGTKAYNQKLGLMRATEVKDALMELGFSPALIVTKSAGESAPMIDATTWDERRLNRRATIELVKEESLDSSLSMN